MNVEQVLIQVKADALRYYWYGQFTASGRVSQTLIVVAFTVIVFTYAHEVMHLESALFTKLGEEQAEQIFAPDVPNTAV